VSESTGVHECNNADFFMSLEKAVGANPQWELLMAAITSPRSADIPEKDIKLKVRDRRTRTTDGTVKEFIVDRHFNPDGLAILREPSREITLNVVETDNNTNNPSDMQSKFEAFIGYGRQGRFAKLIECYARKHLLDIPNPDDILSTHAAHISQNDFVTLPRGEVITRLIKDGTPHVPFIGTVASALQSLHDERHRIITRSRRTFTKPSHTVEDQISKFFQSTTEQTKNKMPAVVRRARN